MSTVSLRTAERFRPRRSTLVYGALLVNTEVLLVALYLLLTDVQVAAWSSVVYPFVWINVGLWALVRTEPTPRSSRQAWIAGGVAAGYLLVLFVVGGLLSLGHPGVENPLLSVSLVTPGTGPVIAIDTGVVQFAAIPFLVIGYTALAYLVYATLLDAAGNAVTGIFGLLSCVSCVWPVLAPLLAAAFGSGAVATAVAFQSRELGTVVFLTTVALLYWRPFKRS
ncbi:DUF7546 family protein [Natronorarus salvus]|uniref:DUF7546 family protein n=1 Tax=Natronorarus salvus TaxID=3117733 RepID=UPI002F260E9C